MLNKNIVTNFLETMVLKKLHVQSLIFDSDYKYSDLKKICIECHYKGHVVTAKQEKWTCTLVREVQICKLQVRILVYPLNLSYISLAMSYKYITTFVLFSCFI